MDVATVTTADRSLLRAIRDTLQDADDVLVCVAFCTEAGVHLVGRQLRGARLLVTTQFGTTRPASLAMALDRGARVKVLNPPGARTFHPKVYLGRTGRRTGAVVGSANLTGGLVTNIEAGLALRGTTTDDPLRDAWTWAEDLWEDARAELWTQDRVAEPEGETLAPDLHAHLVAAVARDPVFPTLARGRPNRVTELTPLGLFVETERTIARRTGPQLVPAWMLNLAWDTLRSHGRLSNRTLLRELHVHRSSAVCAILARVPGVRRAPGRGIVLEWTV